MIGKILIDKRGYGENNIHTILKLRGLPVELTKLESADYVIGHRGIERKTVQDLINSATKGDRHLWKQIEALKDYYSKPIVLIEGKLRNTAMEKSLINSIAVGWNVPIVYTKSMHDTADLLEVIFNKYGKDELSRIPSAVVYKRHKPEQIRLEIVQCFPSIGGVKAQLIMKQCPELFQYSNNDIGIVYLKEKLSQIKGLKPVTINLLLQTLYGTYNATS